MHLTYSSIAKRIDHALLSPALDEATLIAGCSLARSYDVASVCIKPSAIPLAVEILRGSGVAVGTVIGFPHGGQSQKVKLYETSDALESGASEIDLVVNIGDVIGDDWDRVSKEIKIIKDCTHNKRGVLKVIFENCYLTTDQKKRLCDICSELKVDYVKTSTGYGSHGATFDDVQLMRQRCPESVKIKASGGIRDLSTAVRYVELGADRLGLSGTKEILDDLCKQLGIEKRVVPRGTTLPAKTHSEY